MDEGLAICVKALPRDWNATLGADNRIVADFSSTFYTEHITTPFLCPQAPCAQGRLLNRYYIKKDTPLQRGDVGLAAEGTDCTGVDWRAAIRAHPLQKLAAHRAIFPADGICRLAVGKEKPNLLDEILLVRRAVWIRAKTAVKWGSGKVGEWGSVDLGGRD